MLIGRNANIAFTTTSEETVDHQIYQETVDFSHNPPTYRFNGADVPMRRCRTRLTCRANPTQTFVSYRTVHGPVFETDPAHGIAYSMKFASFGQEYKSFKASRSSRPPTTSTSTATRCRTVATLHNFFYADRSGNIAYFGAGLVPELKPCPGLTMPQACDPRLPHDGDGSQEWLGTVPFDQMPHAVNPRNGYLVNWNTKPSAEHFLQQNGGEEYWGTIYHSEPIARDLATHQRLSTADLTAIEADIGRIDDADSRPAAPYFLPEFFKLYRHDRSLHTPQRDAAVAQLQAWNQTRHGRQRRDVDQHAVDAGARAARLRSERGRAVRGRTARTSPVRPRSTCCGTRSTARAVSCRATGCARPSTTTAATPSSDGGGARRRDGAARGHRRAAGHPRRARLRHVRHHEVGMGRGAEQGLGRSRPGCERRGRSRVACTSPTSGRVGTENRSTWMQAMDVGPPAITGVSVMPPGESGFIARDGTFSPHFNDQVPLFNQFAYKPMPPAPSP